MKVGETSKRDKTMARSRHYIVAICIAAASYAATAASATWSGAVDGDPTKAGNWSGTGGCGSLTDIGNRDTATFRGAPPVTMIVPSQTWIIGSFIFSSYNNQAAQWQIGSGNPDAAPICLAGIGSGSLEF
jgi:hypothetical protein